MADRDVPRIEPDGQTDRGGSDGAVPDPQTWTTGDEPATERQRRYLGTLAREADEDVPDDLTKAEASEQIDRLREESGRGG